MTSTNNRDRSVKVLKKAYYRLTEPSPEIIEEELILKIRFFNTTLLFFFIFANIQFFVRIIAFLSSSKVLSISELLQFPFLSFLALTFLFLGHTQYYNYAFTLIFLVPLTQPITAIPLYLDNELADLISVNPMMILTLGILLSGIIYSKKGTVTVTFASIIEMFLFYGIFLKYPVDWVTPKIVFSVTIGFITLVGMIYRERLDQLKDEFKGQRDRFVFMTNHELRNP